MFRSAAYNFGPHVIGVVLTGLLNDGTSGMWSIKRLGGTSVIQQPEDALYPTMPESVQANVDVDYAVPLAQLASLLIELTQENSNDLVDIPPEEIRIAGEENTRCMSIMDYGQLSPLACPECHGSLVSIQEGRLLRFRCHTGHAFTAGSLLTEINKNVEASLWNAVRGLKEVQLLFEKKAQILAGEGDVSVANEYRVSNQKVHERAEKIRQLLFN